MDSGAPISPVEDEIVLGIGGNLLLPQAELLFSTVDRVKELRRQIAVLNGQVSDAYAEAKSGGLAPDEVRWVLSEETMSPQKREEREERDARRDQLSFSYRHVREQRAAAEAAKAQQAAKTAERSI